MKCSVRVSVITPVYNGEKTIRETIEAVLGQTYKNVEYIVVDGASTDRTMEIVKEYEPFFQGRLQYVSEKDRGIYQAMNKGIRLSTGRLIGIINSDDFYETDALEKVVSVMSDDLYQVIYGYLRTIERGGENRVTTVKKESGKMIAHPTCFLTREVYQKYGMFLEWFRIAADYELMLRLYEKNEVRFTQVNSVIANFRTGGASYSSRRRAYFEADLARAMHKKMKLKEFAQSAFEYLAVMQA